ncbi:GNAT family N-acetyltransferase [Agromyces sp. NPDC058110]|uniref:GNAT family N-acetyltransferase n=1 Tax=Agromyces sp. NPDC058110 TaxID=3346345 RepID=UPI0036DF3F2C
MHAGHRFSADPADLDRALVHRWLSTDAYWALGRTREKQEAAIAGSRNYGVYDATTGAQVAYARIVTDAATFAWLCDVYVDPSVRGLGIGVALIEGVIADLEPLGLRRSMLATADAHGLYERFGFEPLAEPDRWMVRWHDANDRGVGGAGSGAGATGDAGAGAAAGPGDPEPPLADPAATP